MVSEGWVGLSEEVDRLITRLKYAGDTEIIDNEEELNRLARLIDARLQDADIGR